MKKDQKKQKGPKEGRIWARADARLSASVDEVCTVLGAPWTVSSAVGAMIEIFLSDGPQKAAERIKAGGWITSAEREAELLRMADLAAARAVVQFQDFRAAGEGRSDRTGEEGA